jgi:hypothetical protein
MWTVENTCRKMLYKTQLSELKQKLKEYLWQTKRLELGSRSSLVEAAGSDATPL